MTAFYSSHGHPISTVLEHTEWGSTQTTGYAGVTHIGSDYSYCVALEVGAKVLEKAWPSFLPELSKLLKNSGPRSWFSTLIPKTFAEHEWRVTLLARQNLVDP